LGDALRLSFKRKLPVPAPPDEPSSSAPGDALVDALEARARLECVICGSAAGPAGSKTSSFSGRAFALAHCPSCHYSFVVEPRTDFADLYNDDYYRGLGADPLTDYEGELKDPRSLRRYEWRGIAEIVDGLPVRRPGLRWLDYGAGLGGLVLEARARGADAYGFDEGYPATRMAATGVPSLAEPELASRRGTFDVVTAIEVLEHLVDPLAVLSEIATLLAPGGYVFATTGNAEPFRGRLARWQYVRPDIHIGFFEPGTLAFAFERVGLEPVYERGSPGFRDLCRYKVLKTLGAKRRSTWEQLIPWPIAARVVDHRYGVSAHPLGHRPVSTA
jgi:SAM-dependent methyltransferase